MAGFLRRKQKPDLPQIPQEKPQPIVTSEEPEPHTPVYARFASTFSQDAPTKRLVSAPMVLGTRPGTGESALQRNEAGPNVLLSYERGPETQDRRPLKSMTPLKLDKPLPAPVPIGEGGVDPLADPPPQSNLPPNRRVSASFQTRPNERVIPPPFKPHDNRIHQPNVALMATVPARAPQDSEYRKDRRVSNPPSQSSPQAIGPSPSKESLFTRIKKSAPPSAYSRPTTSPSSASQTTGVLSSRPLFRKSSVQDLHHTDSISSRLTSSSRYSLAGSDSISLQSPINNARSKAVLPPGGSRPELIMSQKTLLNSMKRRSQDFTGPYQEPILPGKSPGPSGPSSSPKGKPIPLLPPPEIVSRSPDDLKRLSNANSLASHPQSQDQQNGMEVLRPTHPSAHIYDVSSDIRNALRPQPPQSDQVSRRTNKQFPNGPTQGKPLIFAATTTMDHDGDASDLFITPKVQSSPSPSRKPQSVSAGSHPSLSAEIYTPGDFPPKQSSGSSSKHSQPLMNTTIPVSQLPPSRRPSRTRESISSTNGDLRPQTPPKVRKTSRSAGTPDSQNPKTLTKPRPTTPVSIASKKTAAEPVDFELAAPVGIPLDDDPFAKTQGVTMITSPSREGLVSRDGQSIRSKSRTREDSGASSCEVPEAAEDTTHSSPPRPTVSTSPSLSPPASPEEYRNARSRRRGEGLERLPPPVLANVPVRVDRPAEPFPLDLFLIDATLLSCLLPYLSFYDWCILSSVSRKIRLMFIQNRPLTEATLVRYLKTVGYSRWIWSDPDPLPLSLMDLHDYMRGVSIPTHEYAKVAEAYAPALTIHPSHRDSALLENVRHLTAATRAFTRVVLRLRAQAEKESSQKSASIPNGYGSSPSRSSSRPPSPTSSHSHAPNGNTAAPPRAPTPVSGFRSPLYRVRRAPLLRVFVPSPDGDWLSDASVLECEAELKRAGVQHLLRMGDVIWDIAVGDEGNVGRLVWDGSYLIDLDYSYSTVGDLPKYLPTLAFPPSYFHRVIRTGPSSGNPLIRIDLTPWGQEIATNLQLLQDRIRTETPQGAVHNVVRWVHRSSFVIRPPNNRRPSTRGRPSSPRLPIPDSHLFVDPGWYGTVIVETEGTNECLADLQDRCGPGAFPPRALPVSDVANPRDKDSKLVFRILREKSRPGEIWMRAVGPKERLC